MALKWQQVSSGLIGLVILLGGLLNLSGVSFSTDGDKTCTDCFSEIKVNSTYWEIRVEHAGEDKDSVFKKRTRSRTLWVNLDKIEELVTTDPAIKVDILVPTNRIARTEINHPEYGRLRFLKDGDTLIRRTTKSRPGPSRIILHAENVNTIVKWNFDLEHWLLEDINIDPIWFPPKGDTINVQDIKQCHLESFNVTEDVYENITITERILIPCLYYTNYTFINNITGINENRSDVSNRSCNSEISVVREQKVGTKIVTKTREVCRVIGARIAGRDYLWDEVAFNCKRTGSKYTCDSQNADGNDNGVCDDGEDTCFTFDIRDVASDNRFNKFRK